MERRGHESKRLPDDRYGPPFTTTLVVMKIANPMAAGILYLMLAAFALAVLALFLPPSRSLSWSLLASTPEALVLAVTLVVLALISVALGSVFLWRRPRTSVEVRAVRTAAVALPIIALGWNVLAPLFWLLPLVFAWRAAGEARA